jgi:hypothetical protein
MNNATQHALSGDDPTSSEKTYRQSRFPCYAAAEVLYNITVRGLLGAPEALAVGLFNLIRNAESNLQITGVFDCNTETCRPILFLEE